MNFWISRLKGGNPCHRYVPAILTGVSLHGSMQKKLWETSTLLVSGLPDKKTKQKKLIYAEKKRRRKFHFSVSNTAVRSVYKKKAKLNLD